MNDHFDDLRPYHDSEIAPAMQRIADNELFPLLSEYVFPDKETDDVRAMLKQINTIDDFQLRVMKVLNEEVIRRSISRFTFTGLDRLDNTKRYLFVSNHRDIMLDATLLQYALHQAGHRTTEITFGDNLMSSQLAIDIGKSNKMFKLVRKGDSIKELYAISLRLSQYIRHAICEKGESVWIAQRNGRTKNGIDATDQALVKMFGMSVADDPVRALAELNIVPLAISYEWESCDMLKALELLRSRKEKYVKHPGEDMNSILTGIMQPKGDVHIAAGELLTEKLLRSLDCTGNQLYKQTALWIDSQIYKNYRLTSNNYIAHDIRSGENAFADRYSQKQKDDFIAHLMRLDSFETNEEDVLRNIFLGIYANPVDTKATV